MVKRSCDVAVVGGGIVGLSCAYRLASKGRSVALLENKQVGAGASLNNAGYVSPGLGSPIPASSTFTLLWWALSGGPVRVSPAFLLGNAPWFASYLRSGKDVDSARVTRALALESLSLLEEIVEAERLDCDFRRCGILEVYRSERSFEEEVEGLEGLGVKFRALPGEECAGEEPLLAPLARGGIIYEEDCYVDPSKLLWEMARAAKAKGVEILEGEGAARVKEAEGGVAISTGSGDISASECILALGAWARPFLTAHGMRAPILPAYGYAFITEPAPGIKMKRPIICGEPRVATSQLADGRLKASGLFELRELGEVPVKGRLKWVREKAESYLPAFKALEAQVEWAGPRPCTPDGLPIVGRLRSMRRTILAAGHCRLGLTLAAVTGRIVEEIVDGGVGPLELSPSRFKL